MIELQLTDAQCHQINATYQQVQKKRKNEDSIQETPPPWLKELIWKKFPAAKRFYFYDKSPGDSYVGVNGDVMNGQKSTYLGKVDEADAVSVGHSFKELALKTQPKQPEEPPVKEQPAQEM